MKVILDLRIVASIVACLAVFFANNVLAQKSEKERT